MHWEESLIKSKNIEWEYKFNNTNDGKLDFDLHLPLTELFRWQAKKAFEDGMRTMLQFHIKHQESGKAIGIDDLTELFEECGLPEVAEACRQAMK